MNGEYTTEEVRSRRGPLPVPDDLDLEIAIRLLRLCAKHGVKSVADALDLEGIDLDEFLRRSA